MVCLVTISLLLMIGIPSLQFLQAEYRAKITLTTLANHLNLAKSEAITHNSHVGLCPLGPLGACGQNWNNGWVLFRDTNQNNRLDDDESLLFQHQIIDIKDNLEWQAFGLKNGIFFNGYGVLVGLTNGSFTYHTGGIEKKLVLNQVGRIKL